MKQKDIGLLVSICVLAFLAVFSEKKVEVVKGYYVTKAELSQGGEIYRRICRACHGRYSGSGAPGLNDSEGWERRLTKGMNTLIDHALYCTDPRRRMQKKGGHPSLTRQEAEAAVAYMIRRSR